MDNLASPLQANLKQPMPLPLSGVSGSFPGKASERCVLILDLGGWIRHGDDAAASLFNRPMAELLGRPVSEIIPLLQLNPDGRGYNVAFVCFHFSGGEWYGFQGTNRDGVECELGFSVTFLRGDGLSPFFLVHVSRLEHLPRPGDGDFQRLQQALDESDEMAFVTNGDGIIEFANARFETAGGFQCGELLGKSLTSLGSGFESGEHFSYIQSRLQSRRPGATALSLRKRDGGLWCQEAVVRPFLDEDGKITHYVFTGRHGDPGEHALSDLERLANHDYLTGLPNRRLFLDRLSQALARAFRGKGRFAVLYMDLDRFKEVNDRQGHAAGDAMLKTLGTLLLTCVREEDTVARIGGDEFACILADVATPSDTWSVCEKILACLQLPLFQCCDEAGAIGVSIGIAIYPEDGADEATLLQHADQAMYCAKREGGNRWFHFGDAVGSGHKAVQPFLTHPRRSGNWSPAWLPPVFRQRQEQWASGKD